MSAAPRAASPARYPGKPLAEVARLIRAETQLIARLHTANLMSSYWRCHVCKTGRVLIRATEHAGRIRKITTTGHCNTAGCLHWEDTP